MGLVDVLFVEPPFAATAVPSLYFSVLKQILVEQSIKASILYANLMLSREMGGKEYSKISQSPFSCFRDAELIFSSFAFPGLTRESESAQPVYKGIEPDNISFVDEFGFLKNRRDIIEKVKTYLDKLLDKIIKQEPGILWLGSYVKQMTAAIAIARIVKEKNPGIIVVFSGHNCYSPAAQMLIKKFPVIDYIFTGEPDEEITRFCKNLVQQGTLPAEKIIQCKPVMRLDTLPFPDYSDYFNQADLFASIKTPIPMETSRGCWWGEKKKCLFCGIHPDCDLYREKSSERIFKEISYLIEKYKPVQIVFKDTVLPKDAAEKIFRPVSAAFGSIKMFGEIKPYLSYEELKSAKQAGLTYCQPGIETLNSRLLDLLRKGTRLPHIIRFLRDCRSLGIMPGWNFLYAIPGETPDDYHLMMKIIPLLFHLAPPKEIRPLILQRFSPLYEEASMHNITNIKPIPVFDFPHNPYTNEEEEQLSLFFTGEYKTAFDDEDLKKRFFSMIRTWKAAWNENPPVLNIEKTNNGYMITDSRASGTIITRDLNEEAFQVLKALEKPVPVKRAAAWKNKSLEILLQDRFIVDTGSCYVALVTGIKEIT